MKNNQSVESPLKIDILTLFPEMFAPLTQSILGRAVKESKLEIATHNIRDYSIDKHKKCDDTPCGGGAGMVMTAQPIFDAVKAVYKEGARRIYLSPKGKILTQEKAKELANEKHLILLCGHYEGVDQRALDLCIDEEISIGDYVLTGGELPAMVLVDSVARFIPGILGSDESAHTDSFSDGLLEYPQYTRPQVFEGLAVPEVLLGGNHAKIAEWRKEQQIEITKKQRPDLFKKSVTYKNGIAVIKGEGLILTDVQSALDLIGEAGSDKIIVFKENIAEDFFKLSTGKLGEVLQKFVNYGISVAIVGDFSAYTSKPLKDFIYESNKGRHVFFVADEKTATEQLLR